jgi:Transglutaminase-like superfamily
MRVAVALLAVVCGGVAFGDEAVIFVPTALAARVEEGRRSGLSIALEGRPDGARVWVSQAVQALPAAAGFPLSDPERCRDATALEVPPSFVAPPWLTAVQARGGSAFEVVASVVELVSQRITLDENDAGPQDGLSVLRRGRGRCSGRANLAVGLLRAAGIPARVVHGLVAGASGARWHRWGEAWLGEAGWVAFDPSAAVGLVSVRYLPLRGAGEGPALAGVRLERTNEHGFLGLPVRRGLRVLPVGGVTLRCIAPPGETTISALLVGPDGSRWARQGQGEVVFVGMLPGRYRIVWRGSGRPSALNLELAGEHQVRVELSVPGEAGS